MACLPGRLRWMSALYLLLALLFAGVLVWFLWRPGLARPMVVWGFAALLPLLVALAGSLSAQARAARTLRAYKPQAVAVVVRNGSEVQALELSAQDAACLERAVRLNTRATLVSGGQTVRISSGTQVEGSLPSPQVVEALTLRGELHCRNLKATPQPDKE